MKQKSYAVSLSGTGIGLHMVSAVDKSNVENPKGVILEAPFNNMKDEIKKHPFSLVSSAVRLVVCEDFQI